MRQLAALSGLTSLRLELNPQLPAAAALGDEALDVLGRLTTLRRLQLANAVGVMDAGLRPLVRLAALTNLRLSGACFMWQFRLCLYGAGVDAWPCMAGPCIHHLRAAACIAADSTTRVSGGIVSTQLPECAHKPQL